ncbi:MAG: hypothetical protein E6248_10205 [Clostridium sp.]|uniref:hypothetical protein n=1 Tax=Clostridium sp. TaxID=1506 RepID=UPI002911B115|nr:hypothetical protein [Clostridium sp.]MDU5110811.1 hypothetical protein [Clostridium sp.]
MGRFKEIYINYLNLDKEGREHIKICSKEYIYDNKNRKLLLSQYILMSSKYIYEIKAAEGTAHLWTWSDFKDEAKGKILSYKTEGNVILSQLLEFEEELDVEVLCKYGLEIVIRLN